MSRNHGPNSCLEILHQNISITAREPSHRQAKPRPRTFMISLTGRWTLLRNSTTSVMTDTRYTATTPDGPTRHHQSRLAVFGLVGVTILLLIFNYPHREHHTVTPAVLWRSVRGYPDTLRDSAQPIASAKARHPLHNTPSQGLEERSSAGLTGSTTKGNAQSTTRDSKFWSCLNDIVKPHTRLTLSLL